jgi:hypothetical protein
MQSVKVYLFTQVIKSQVISQLSSCNLKKIIFQQAAHTFINVQPMKYFIFLPPD